MFDNCFELILKEDYERNFHFRDVLKKEAEVKARDEYRQSQMSGIGRLTKSMKKLPTSVIAPARHSSMQQRRTNQSVRDNSSVASSSSKMKRFRSPIV